MDSDGNAAGSSIAHGLAEILIKASGCQLNVYGGDCEDGHGTHVAGSVAGAPAADYDLAAARAEVMTMR